MIDPIDVAVVWDSSSVTGDWVAANQSDIVAYGEPLIYADFTVVPVPPAVWLLGSAMVAVGAIARRRNKTA